ncbi:YggS family pyridoxal phosphate-dependent enzyme [Solimonas fluminis]|uniref:Pyridoxal phosphate homeostasis protein n=1 Tax=Solimonas fluminis TaxID=2086571 RepID=A0A2S5TLP0_9GAMM|nr:YggS family pyridoxal phosphate-dependent enzyme [Solimonas fluminis]PPE75906.1 YggS family pyridoxal phosphate-dependent enzyme [Solimonas fluminis]
MTDIPYNLASVRTRIAAACKAAGRPGTAVELLAVSKTFGPAEIRQAQAAGQRAFGENYLQEALDKQAQLADLALEWHFIGPVQSNKTRPLAERFDWVHGVERLKIAQRLSEQRPAALPPLDVCVQVNVSGEASKSGCAPAETLELCRAVARLPRLRLRGLMAIPAPAAAAADRRAPFRALRGLFDELRRSGLEVDTISAGMSDDLEDAIAEGSTLVRVGSALFGSRPPKA